MLSGSPSRSRGPGSSSRKKSASCSSKDRSPLGTILIGRWSESDCLEVGGGGAASRVDPGGVLIGTAGASRRDRASCGLGGTSAGLPPCPWRCVYRSDARFDSAFRQIRSSSLGIVSSIWRGGRASVVAISSSDAPGRESPPERSSPGQQLVEHHAQAEDVGSTIDPVTFAPGLLGTHVGRSSSNPATLAEVLVSERKTEVGDDRAYPRRRSGCWRA